MIYFNVYIYIYEKAGVDGKLGSDVYEVEEEEKGGYGKVGRVMGVGPGQGVVLGKTKPNKSSAPSQTDKNFVVIYLPLSM